MAYLLPEGKSFKTSNLEPLQLATEEAKPHFIVKKNSHYTIDCRVRAGSMEYELKDNESSGPLFFSYNHQLHLWKDTAVIHLVEKFQEKGQMSIEPEEWNKTLHQFILPLTREHKVDFDKSTAKVDRLF